MTTRIPESPGLELESYPSPPTSRRHSPELPDKDANELEAQTSRRIAHSYPFLLSQQPVLGALGDREGEERDPLLLKERVQESGKAYKRKKKVQDFYDDQRRASIRSSGQLEENVWSIYSAVMAGASVILIVESIQEIASFHLVSTIIVAISVLTKFCLFLYCYRVRHMGPACRVLYEDHRNDLGLNGFALLTNSLGAKIRWWIDPAGAILMSAVLIYLWGSSAIMELNCLAGIGAPKDVQELVIYKAMTFSDKVVQIDSCKVFHSGTNYVVELDVVMPPETPLHIAHDISQILQDQLETLPSVDRCYVHIDHETSHSPEHRKYV
ncbi:hypothetical protein RQP46_008506 [Phenoliferia psychrophenolica]